MSRKPGKSKLVRNSQAIKAKNEAIKVQKAKVTRYKTGAKIGAGALAVGAAGYGVKKLVDRSRMQKSANQRKDSISKKDADDRIATRVAKKGASVGATIGAAHGLGNSIHLTSNYKLLAKKSLKNSLKSGLKGAGLGGVGGALIGKGIQKDIKKADALATERKKKKER